MSATRSRRRGWWILLLALVLALPVAGCGAAIDPECVAEGACEDDEECCSGVCGSDGYCKPDGDAG